MITGTSLLFLTCILFGCGIRTSSGSQILTSDAENAVKLVDQAMSVARNNWVEDGVLESAEAQKWHSAIIKRFDNQGNLSSHMDESNVVKELFISTIEEANKRFGKDSRSSARQTILSVAASSYIEWFGLATQHLTSRQRGVSVEHLMRQIESQALSAGVVLQLENGQPLPLSH